MARAGRNTGFVLLTLAAGAGAAYAAPPAAVTLPGDRAFPESITSTTDGTLYVGSLASGGIVRVPVGATEAQPWVAPGAFGTRSTFGVLADEKTQTLWVCSNDVSALGVAGPSEVKGSFLKGFDLKTGDGKSSARLPGDKTLCNDIAIGPDARVYITNSLAPEILRLSEDGKTLEVWKTDPLLAPPAKGAGLDGLAFGADGTLYADTFTHGALFRIDVKDGVAGKVTRLQTSQPIELADALRPIEGGKAFLMIEGKGNLDRVTMSGDDAKIETLKDGLDGPTGVTPTGNTAWVSEGQLNALFQKGQPHLPFKLRSVTLPTP